MDAKPPKNSQCSKLTAVDVSKNACLDATHVQRIWDMFIGGVIINQRYCGCGRHVTAIAVAIAKIVAKIQLLLAGSAWGPAMVADNIRRSIHGYCGSTVTYKFEAMVVMNTSASVPNLRQWLACVGK